MGRWMPWLLPLALGLALIEVAAHAAIRAGVPTAADHAAAADFLRAEMGPREAVAAAPDYVDPLLRLHLGGRIDPAMAGRSDLSAYDGLWVLSLHGALPDDAPDLSPVRSERFGPLAVHHFPLPAPTVRHDFVAALPDARVTRRGRDCRFRPAAAPARGGGLGKGVIAPPARFDCAPRDPHGFVGAVVMEDLSLRPRHCVFQHPTGPEPVSVTFEDVPLADELVVYGGLYYEHERMREGAPVDLEIAIDGVPRARMHHVDGDGWARLSVPTGGGRGQVRFSVTSVNPRRRGFCWSATTRAGPAR